MNKKKYKVFEGETLQESFDKLLKAGYRVGGVEEILIAKRLNKIPNVWYDTNLVEINGIIRKAKLSELKNLKGLYAKGGRVLFLSRNLGLFGGLLDSVGRSFGVSAGGAK